MGLRIKRDVTSGNGADVSPEQDAIIWLKKEKELVTPEGSLRRAATINTEFSVYNNLAKAHSNNPAGKNDARAEFYFQKVVDIANNRDRVGFAVSGAREGFVGLFKLYVKTERVDEASGLFQTFLSKGSARGWFDRRGSIESLVVYDCTGAIVTCDITNTSMKTFMPVLEKYIETLEFIVGDAIPTLYFTMYTNFNFSCSYSKALSYAKKRLKAIQRAPERRNGKLAFSAMIEISESQMHLGKYKDALSELKVAETIIRPFQKDTVGFQDENLCGAWEQSVVYELFGDTLKEQAQMEKTKQLKKEMNEKSISYFKKSSDLRYGLLDGSYRIEGTDPDYFLSAAVRTSQKIGRQYANLKKWSRAKKYYMFGIERAERAEIESGSMVMTCQDFGRVFLDQYLDPNYFESEEAFHLLQSAVKYTQKALAAFQIYSPMVMDLSFNKVPMSFDIAVESYFSGRIDEACHTLGCHLMAMTVEKGCAGCGHAHVEGTDVVSKVCTSCDAVYYCNDACQQRNWINIDDKRKSHKILCPLLKEFKYDTAVVEEIESSATYQRLLDYFEGLKPSKCKKKHSYIIDPID